MADAQAYPVRVEASLDAPLSRWLCSAGTVARSGLTAGER